MWEVMTSCMIIHNITIESGRDALVINNQPYKHMCPLANIDHEVSAKFGPFLVMYQEIRDKTCTCITTRSRGAFMGIQIKCPRGLIYLNFKLQCELFYFYV